jgi:hypothetical protein
VLLLGLLPGPALRAFEKAGEDVSTADRNPSISIETPAP